MSYPIKGMQHALPGDQPMSFGQTRKDEFAAQSNVISNTFRTCQICSEPCRHYRLDLDTVDIGHTDLPAVSDCSVTCGRQHAQPNRAVAERIHRDDPTAFLALIDEVLASGRLPAGVHRGPEVAVVDLADASPEVVA